MVTRIIKADGQEEIFKREKLEVSLRKAGAPKTDAQAIAREIEESLGDTAYSGVLYRQALDRLRNTKVGAAARYSLKRAVLELGPSGFPFEAYLAELFRKDGFTATTNVITAGACIEHEVDVLLEKDGIRTYLEAKFHNSAAFKTDVRVTLYVKARIDDIRARVGDSVRGMVATNTRFTDTALRYGSCVGLDLLSWEYPHGNTLHDRIERTGLYPVTALTTLSKVEKTALMAQKMVLCNTIITTPQALEGFNLSPARLERIVAEAGALCAS